MQSFAEGMELFVFGVFGSRIVVVAEDSGLQGFDALSLGQ
jgi:hypothetical protein